MDEQKMDALAGLVDEVDGDSPEAQAQQQAQAQAEDDAERQAREWGVVAWSIGSALSLMAPELRQVYTEDACLGWGRSMVPVAEKYGWNGPGNVPELGALMATAGLAVPSYFAIKAKLELMREAKRQAEAAKRAQALQADAQGAGDGG